jgi:hypothetical protein
MLTRDAQWRPSVCAKHGQLHDVSRALLSCGTNDLPLPIGLTRALRGDQEDTINTAQRVDDCRWRVEVPRCVLDELTKLLPRPFRVSNEDTRALSGDGQTPNYFLADGTRRSRYEDHEGLLFLRYATTSRSKSTDTPAAPGDAPNNAEQTANATQPVICIVLALGRRNY